MKIEQTDLQKVVKKLEDARAKAGSYGRKYGNFATADDYLKITDAELEDQAPEGKVGERDAWVKRHPKHLEAVERKRDVTADWKTAEVWMKLLFEEVGALRSQEATNRWIDKGHT